MAKILLEMRSITKTFPGVKALSDVNIKVEEGEIHALVGENGAGKSTLMNVLSGIYPHGSYTGETPPEGTNSLWNSRPKLTPVSLPTNMAQPTTTRNRV